MGLLDDLKRMFRREATDAKEWLDEAVGDGHQALDRAEKKLSADPSERMDAVLEDIESGDDAFSAIQAKADQALGKAEAKAEMAEDESDVEDQDDSGDPS